MAIAAAAVCLFSIEDYRLLRKDGVMCDPPGTFGENVLTEGLDFSRFRADDELSIGEEVRIAIHDVREPCKTLKSVDERFPNLKRLADLVAARPAMQRVIQKNS